MTNEAKRWYVSRQCYWGVDDPLVVEIALGGLDYAGSDMLGDTRDHKYGKLGCDQEYSDPRWALLAALKVRRIWSREMLHEPDERCNIPRIEVGYTGGYTLPFEEYPTAWDLYAWAHKEHDDLPKCVKCGEILGDQRYSWFGQEWEEDEYCSQHCADESWRSWIEENTQAWTCPECGEENQDSDVITSNPSCWACDKSFDWWKLEEAINDNT